MTDGPWRGDYHLETPERVALSYDVAGLGSRFLPALVDMIVQTVLAIIIFFLGTLGLGTVFAGVGDALGIDDELGPVLAVAITLLLGFAIFGGYFVFFETLWHGQSPGKRLFGLRVIKEGGYPIGFSEALIRNLVRLVDFLPAYYMIGVTAMLIDGRARRLGDLAAGTIVVKERRGVTLASLRAPAGPSVASDAESTDVVGIPNLRRLTAAEQSLLREYLARRPSLAGPAARSLATTLATSLARRLDHDLAGEDPELFLARLARHLDARS